MEQITDAIIIVEDNRLVFTKEALDSLNVKTDDKLSINYYTINPEESFPVIAKTGVFSDEGNRVTKKRTMSFRGSQNQLLREYGNSFFLEKFKTFFKLIPVSLQDENVLAEEELYLENLNTKLN